MLTIQLSAAFACGGLFCSTTPENPLPVVQNAERIAFAIDGGYVETHVQVFYEGPPDAFAWVVPVPGDVEVFPSNEVLFQVLDQQLSPRFVVDQRVTGRCGGRGLSLGCSENELGLSVRGPPVDTAAPPDVHVASEGQVGPYDYVVLTGTTEAAIVGYLNDEGYDFDPSMAEALQPYLAADSHFLAVRLQKDRDTGDIAPLGFRYAGNQATLPIQLTRIAAVDDMGIQVNVFGGSKAVSDNYLHVTLDEAKIDWLNQGQNYFDLVARGVDEAGGHAVVTEFAGDTAGLRDTVWSAEQEGWARILHETTDPGTFFEALTTMALPQNAALTYGTDGRFTPEDWEVLSAADLEQVELTELANDLDTRLFANLRRIQAMLDLPYVTRMSTTLDPAEMTLDPTFVLNHATPDVTQDRTLIATTHCKGGRTPLTEWTLEDGRNYRATRQAPDLDRTESIALRIERWSAEGPPEVVVDHTEDALDASDPAFKRCGCEGVPGLPSALIAMLGSLLVARRRR